jgi:hypothetical protein
VILCLHRRTRQRAVRAKHAAISRLGFQPLATGLAVIEDLAGVGRHGLDCLMTATRTGERRFQLNCIAISLHGFAISRWTSDEFDPWSKKIAVVFDSTPVTCPALKRVAELNIAKEKGAARRPRYPPRHGHSIHQQHHADDHQRTANKHHRWPAASSPTIAPLGAPLRDQRHFVFVRGGEYAGKPAARRCRCRFERHQSGVGVRTGRRFHTGIISIEW